MRDLALRVTGVSKCYRLGQRNQYATLREVLADVPRRPLRMLRRGVTSRAQIRSAAASTIWALKDVSFEVKTGEVIGIIGSNGAGKSTLLKILSRITKPTTGRVEAYGSVGSLLEVGTGFHPELTGRENIFLNGAILGMKRAEIHRKLDAIVAFAEVDRFLDTPVKRYSSGMHVRLAFAVAAHLEPQILIVDEVLAVGDVAFQKKCLGAMSGIARAGRTVLFVSHNMPAVERLCQRAIWLAQGRITAEGPTADVVRQYLQAAETASAEVRWPDKASAPGNDQVRLRYACVRPAAGSARDLISVDTSFTVEFEYWDEVADGPLDLSIRLYSAQDVLIFDVGRTVRPVGLPRAGPGTLWRDVCRVPGSLLNDGRHRIDVCVSKAERTIYEHCDVLTFDVHDGLERRGTWYGPWPGAIRPLLEWRTERADPEGA